MTSLLSVGQQVRLPELAGTESPHFEIQEVVAGGMGVCARARPVGTAGEDVALKVIRPDLLASPEAWRRFAREVEVWSRLTEIPGVVPTYGATRWEGFLVVISPWMVGGDLGSQPQEPSPHGYFDLAVRVATALSQSYRLHGVVHRDIKPGNILFDDNGRAHVTDWGLAGGLVSQVPGSEGPNTDARLTTAGTFMGTPLYAAPEQFLNSATVDWRADLYSLGCVLCELEGGEPPFLGSLQSLRDQHLQRPPPRLGGIFSRGRYGTAEIVERCLQKSPDQRYSSWDEFILAIVQVASASSVSVQVPAPSREPKRVTSRDHRFALVEWSSLVADTVETSSLIALGRYDEARKLLAPTYIEELASGPGPWTMHHGLACDYALCLTNIESYLPEGVRIFRGLSDASGKPAEFYLNFSDALMRSGELEVAEEVARAGLERFGSDHELLGNLSLCLAWQGRFDQATSLGVQRLAEARGLNALYDLARIYHREALEHEEDWPRATDRLGHALRLLNEGRSVNPWYGGALYLRAQVLRSLFQFSAASEACVELFRSPQAAGYAELAIALQVAILWDQREPDAAVELADRWATRLGSRYAATSIRRTKARILLDTRMIGWERDGQRVVIRDVLDFYERQLTDDSGLTADDLIDLARTYDWMGRHEDAHAALDDCLARWPWSIDPNSIFGPGIKRSRSGRL